MKKVYVKEIKGLEISTRESQERLKEVFMLGPSVVRRLRRVVKTGDLYEVVNFILKLERECTLKRDSHGEYFGKGYFTSLGKYISEHGIPSPE